MPGRAHVVVSRARARATSQASPASARITSQTGCSPGLERRRDRPVDPAALHELLLPESWVDVHGAVAARERRRTRCSHGPEPAGRAAPREEQRGERAAGRRARPWCWPRWTAASGPVRRRKLLADEQVARAGGSRAPRRSTAARGRRRRRRARSGAGRPGARGANEVPARSAAATVRPEREQRRRAPGRALTQRASRSS